MRRFVQEQRTSQHRPSPGSTKPSRAIPGQSRQVNSFFHLQRSIGNQAVQRLLQSKADNGEEGSHTSVDHDVSRLPARANGHRNIQPKLKVNALGDIYEREADHLADQVMRVSEPRLPRACYKCRELQGPLPHVQAKAVQGRDAHDAGEPGMSPLVQKIISSPGRSLDSPTRDFMESRFGHDFAHVRVYSDAVSADSARVLGARAYTIRQNIVFAAGQYRPQVAEGKRLIAHELTHVLQQGGGRPVPGNLPSISPTKGPQRIARTPDQTVTQPTELLGRSPDFEDLWRDFRLDMLGSPTLELRERARTLLQVLVASGSHAARQIHGLELALWFHQHGMPSEAAEALSTVEGAWLVGAALRQSDVPATTLFGSLSDGPGSLIQRAEQAARANRHTIAFRMFGLAFLFLQMQLVQATERRAESLQSDAAAQAADITRAMFTYPIVSQIYDHMRRVLGFYFELEREANAAGQSQRAAQLAGLAVQLRQHLRENYMWSGEAMIAEVTRIQTPMGPGLRLHGANAAETELTPFQGLPTPEEVGTGSYQWQELEGIEESLWGQVQFLSELRHHPEIEREFPGQTIDMNNVDHRLRIWRAMFGIFQQQSGGADALGDLMALIGRYLRAFTIHTQYSIRDWGQNYLTSDMPVDLVDRAERDCGVYALTVAYEVFRTARSASPRLNLEFELTVVPSHVVLVIYDLDNGSFYLVNNDQISPRQSGGRPEAEAAVAPAVAGVFGRRNFVTPSIRMDIGSTRLPTDRFIRQAWQRYRQVSGWSLAPEQPSGTDDTRSPAELGEAGHRRFYDRQEEFDQRTRQLGDLLTRLSSELEPISTDEQRSRLATRIPDIAAAARHLGMLFITLGPAAPIGVDPSRPELIQRLGPLKRYLFSWQPTGSSHPLARTAMGLLRFQHLGGSLSADDQAFITWCDSISAFNNDLTNYRQNGFPANF